MNLNILKPIAISISLMLSVLAVDFLAHFIFIDRFVTIALVDAFAIGFLFFYFFQKTEIEVLISFKGINKWIIFFLLTVFLFIGYKHATYYNHFGIGLLLLMYNLAIATVEELIFRQYLFVKLFQRNKMIFSVIISSIVFGVGHSFNLINGAHYYEVINQIMYATGIAVLFSAIFIRTKSIVIPILIHAIINMNFEKGYSNVESIEITQVGEVGFQFSLIFPLGIIVGLLIIYTIRNYTFDTWRNYNNKSKMI